MTSHRVLVVGAGIAGAAAAALLGRAGHEVTLVERASFPRSSGAPVDVRGAALTVARVLGVEPALRAADTGTRRIVFLDHGGKVQARTSVRKAVSHDIEVARAALGNTLLDVAREHAEVLMGDGPASLASDPDGVEVTFESGATRRFDLVIGADGQHSTTRRLAWGKEEQFRTPIGLVIATLPVPLDVAPEAVLLHNEPGVSVGIHPAGGRPIASFIFRSHLRDAPHERNAQAQLLRDRYASVSWRAPELLGYLDDYLDDLYFDVVSRVRVPAWFSGRVALLGDAASSVTILGDGSSMAMIGANALSEALNGAPDLRAALRRYEAQHRTIVESHQRGVRLGAAFLAPRTRLGISARNTIVRLGIGA